MFLFAHVKQMFLINFAELKAEFLKIFKKTNSFTKKNFILLLWIKFDLITYKFNKISNNVTKITKKFNKIIDNFIEVNYNLNGYSGKLVKITEKFNKSQFYFYEIISTRLVLLKLFFYNNNFRFVISYPLFFPLLF